MHSLSFVFCCALLLMAPAAFADHPADHADHADHRGHAEAGPSEDPAEAGPFQAVVTVQGIVCSFCAAGATKSLSKVPGLDPSRFTKGVHVDIDNQKLTLAFKPSALLPVSQIREAIRSAGYEPVSLSIELDDWESAE